MKREDEWQAIPVVPLRSFPLILDLYDQEGEDEDCAIAVLHARGSKLEFEAGAALCGERRRTSVSSEPTSCPN